MSIKNAQPCETYEGLKRQFLAMKNLLQSKDAQILLYDKKLKEFDYARIIKLEAELESQKEMNAILTEEIELMQKSKP
jgi:hypothetical protein